MKRMQMNMRLLAVLALLATPVHAVEQKADIRGAAVYEDSSNPGVPLLDLSTDELDITAGAAAHLSYAGLANNIGSHGGDPSGSNDSRAALEAALDAAESSGGELAVYIPAGRWAIKSNLSHVFASDLTIFGEGTLVIDDTSDPGKIGIRFTAHNGAKLTWRGVKIEVATTTVGDPDIQGVTGEVRAALTIIHGQGTNSDSLADDALAGDRTITVVDSTGFEVGDLIWIKGASDSWPYDPNVQNPKNPAIGEIHLIEAISDNNITLNAPLFHSYDDSAISPTVHQRTPVEVHIDGLEIRYASYDPESDDGNDPVGLRANYLANSTVRNFVSYGARHSGCALGRSYNVAFVGGSVNEGDDLSLGYGVQVSGSTFVSFTGMHGHRCRRSIDFIENGPSGFICNACRVVGGVFEGLDNKGSCVGTHSGAYMTTFDGVTCIAGVEGIISRSPYTMIQGCTFYGQQEEAIQIHGGGGFEIVNNSMPGPGVDVTGLQNDTTNKVFVTITEPSGSDTFGLATAEQVIRGNTVTATDTFIDVRNDVSDIENLTIDDNYVALQSDSAGNNTEFLNFQHTSDVDLTNIKIRRNDVRNVVGTYANFRTSGGDLDFFNSLAEGNSGELASNTYTANAWAFIPAGLPSFLDSSIGRLRDAPVPGMTQFVAGTNSGESEFRVEHHADAGGSTEIFYLDPGEYIRLVWLGSEWATLENTGSTSSD